MYICMLFIHTITHWGNHTKVFCGKVDFLKSVLLPSPDPLLIVDDTIIPETGSIKVLGFNFNSLLTREPQVANRYAVAC